jgi:transposase-like protein
MDFRPPRCPNRDCVQHRDPHAGFCHRCGFYRAKRHHGPVQRFRCSSCRRRFSMQTFRHDYRDRRPELNAPLFRLLSSGVGLRQSGRQLGLDVHSVQRKFRKIARCVQHLQGNLTARMRPARRFVFDELETFEGKSIHTLTVPILVEQESMFVVAHAAAPIRRLAARGSSRRRWQDQDEKDNGRRKDKSRQIVFAVLDRLLQLCPEGPLTLVTDEKTSYPPIVRQLFGGRAGHEQYSSRRRRNTRNPLFRINLTLAMQRDNNGRLRRRSWLVTKKACFLDLQMYVFAAYRNFHRKRFNTDPEGLTPAVILGFLPRVLAIHELLAWRQDWAMLSPHPMCSTGRTTVADRVA